MDAGARHVEVEDADQQVFMMPITHRGAQVPTYCQ